MIPEASANSKVLSKSWVRPMYGHKATAKDIDQSISTGSLKDPRTWSASPLLRLSIGQWDASSNLIHQKSNPTIVNPSRH
jgi:hypothetical protein